MHKNDKQNYKYLNRCHYFGRLVDIESVTDPKDDTILHSILKFRCYSATEFFANSTNVRVYVPDDICYRLINELFIGQDYYIIASPYKVAFKQNYPHRVDLLLNIFQRII